MPRLLEGDNVSIVVVWLGCVAISLTVGGFSSGNVN